MATAISRMPQQVMRILRTCVSRLLLVHNHKVELTKFETRVLLKYYWKQDYKATAAAGRISEMERESVVSERAAQLWFQRFKTEKKKH